MTSKTYKEMISILPAFSTHKDKMRGVYNIINNEVSQTLASKSNKKNFVFGFHRKNQPSTNSSQIKKMIYDPTSQEDVACEKIIEIFKECLQFNIIKKIPLEPKFADPRKKVINLIFCNGINFLWADSRF